MFTIHSTLGVKTGTWRHPYKKHFSSFTATCSTKILIFQLLPNRSVSPKTLSRRLSANPATHSLHRFFLSCCSISRWLLTTIAGQQAATTAPKSAVAPVWVLFSAEVSIVQFILAPSIPRIQQVHTGQRQGRRSQKSNVQIVWGWMIPTCNEFIGDKYGPKKWHEILDNRYLR